jgi:hypothetical protein
VTTIDTAAAWNVKSRIARAAFAVLFAAGVAGCSTNGPGLLSTSNPAPVASAPTNQPPVHPAQHRGKVFIAQVVGAPDAVEREIKGSLGNALQQNGISIAGDAAEKPDYTVRGYVVAARETGGTKVSYIWDVYNSADKRVNRITGEELISGAGAGDPWASVSGRIVQTITNKTATSLAAWMPSNGGGSTAVAATAPSTPLSTAAVSREPQSPAATTRQPEPRVASSAPAAGSAFKAMVPRVTGAPGDGSVSLATALQKQLALKGIPTSTAGGADVYRVEGIVEIGPGSNGTQPIKIDWIVKNPNGQEVGRVSQKNSIPAGSLNGNWGGTADAAAEAATEGILRLLPSGNQRS